MVNEGSFKENLKPIDFGNRKIKGSYFRGVQYSGQLVTPFDTAEQQQEVSELLVKTYKEHFGGDIDQVVPVDLQVDFEVFGLNILYHRQVQNRIFLFPIQTVAPDIDNLIEYNSKAQQIYREDGVYGESGVRDRGHLENVAYTLKNPYVYDVNRHPSILNKAAFLWSQIAGLQAFSNGNKRTAMVATLVFLHSNGYDFVFRKGLRQELIDFSVQIAVKEVDIDEISGHIFDNVRLNLFNEDWNTIEQLTNDYPEGQEWQSMQENKKVKTTFIKNVHGNQLSEATQQKILKESADEIFANKIVQEIMAELAKI